MARSPVQPPVRMCVGCRRRAAATELLRIVVEDRGAGPELVPDPRRRAPGRGVHLHLSTDCLTSALRRRAFPRALRVQGALGSERLAEHVRQWESQPPTRVRSGGDTPSTD